MQLENNFIVLNIREYLESDDERLGEDKLLQLLSEFSCPLNPDVERFLKQQSIEFAKKHQAVTYLIAQLGKNYNDRAKGRITGKELLEAAIRQTQALQYQAGGMVTFVEAEKNAKLISFYENYGFKQFDTRQSVSKEIEAHELVQLLRLL